MSIDVSITDNSDAIKDEFKTRLNTVLDAIGMVAEGYAKANTPVDTGRLRNSITHIVDGSDVYIGTNVEYAPFVEDGSVHNVAHHMLRDSATGHTAEYKDILEKGLS